MGLNERERDKNRDRGRNDIIFYFFIQIESEDKKMEIPFDIDTSSPLINMKINGENKLFQVRFDNLCISLKLFSIEIIIKYL